MVQRGQVVDYPHEFLNFFAQKLQYKKQLLMKRTFIPTQKYFTQRKLRMNMKQFQIENIQTYIGLILS